ncbi:MAG: TonB-dependent receptor [Deltaproteobacteria bacterium]|nr:TonB-dependent receptor [Deltaproteobacteria bacterium]
MEPRFLITLRLACAALLASIPLLSPTTARAQSATTGAIAGRVTDLVSHKPVADVNVWVTSPALLEPQSAVTDEDGKFKITELLPGVYDVSFFLGKTHVERKNITVNSNSVASVYQRLAIDPKAVGTTIVIEDEPPAEIDVTTTDHGQRIDRRQLEKLPLPGRTIEAAAGSQAGAHNDGVGIAFSGSTALENRFLVDGIDITGLTFGDVGTPILNDFVQEIQVLTGGYSAEWGRSTGGIVNVVSRSGSNRFSGSVFGTLSPGFLTAGRERTPVNASSIDVVANRAYAADFGVTLGGPIIKDRLWFFAGLSPQLTRTDFTRSVKRQVDCHKLMPDGRLSGCDARNPQDGGFADGAPDIDPSTGFFITEEIERSVRNGTAQSLSAIGKINLAITPRHQAAVSLITVPSQSRTPGLFGLPTSGAVGAGTTIDGAAHWTSKLGDGKTELTGVVAWHHASAQSGSIDPSLDAMPRQVLTGGNLGTWAGLGGESAAVAAKCADGGPGDPFINITNCPMTTLPYATGGPGNVRRDSEDRWNAKFAVLRRGRLAGTHEIKAGLDLEDNHKVASRLFSGGAFLENRAGIVTVTRWVSLAGPGEKDARYDQMCTTPDLDGGGPASGGKRSFACDYLADGSPGTSVEGRTLNWAAFLRDSWQILPNLTINAGLRYEEQKLYYASNLRQTIDPLTGNSIGKIAMNLKGNIAPRLGVIWDPTRVGQSKLFVSFGRFHEAIPMDINDRSFGGEVRYQQIYNAMKPGSPCGPSDPRIGAPDGMGCLTSTEKADSTQLIGSSGVLVAPGIKAQYMDEVMGGGEFQLMKNLKLGAVFQKRMLGRVIEDVSTDGASTYIIANPGDWSDADEAAFRARIDGITDPKLKARLESQLEMFRGIRNFDRPTRDYTALELSLARRFAGGLFVRASYTFSNTRGNFPGSVSYDNGQIDPNISSQYDLVELLANRQGPLPQDRPHSMKLDGYYTRELGKVSALTVGSRIRGVSGIPINALGAHYLYGPDESFLLPRGSLGRTQFEHAVDVHVAYARKLGKTTAAEVFLDVFNVYNRQAQFNVDATYAPALRRTSSIASSGRPNNVNPISGGTYEDLIFAKSIDQDGVETAIPTAVNPNFRRTAARYAPASTQVGFRLTF